MRALVRIIGGTIVGCVLAVHIGIDGWKYVLWVVGVALYLGAEWSGQ